MTPVPVHFYKNSANMPARIAIKGDSINTLRHFGQRGQSASHMGPHTAVEPHAAVPT